MDPSENPKSIDRIGGRKINILHVIEALPFGGAENLLLTLARNVDRERFNLVFCCLVKGGAIADKLREEGFKVVCLESYRMRYLYKKIMDIHRLIKTEKIDIVQTHLISANLLGRLGALMSGAMICKTEHAILPDLWREPTFSNRAYLIADKLLNRFTDCIIYVSEAQRRLIQSDGRKLPKHIVIHNGFDEKHFTLHRTRERVRRLYGFSERDIVIGIVGRLVQQKGHRYLFEAVKRIKAKYSGTKLLVVGSGPEELQLKELARSLALEVVFLSGRDDVPELMKAMDIYVQPSRCEPFGISILEAMHSGLPVVATDRGGIPELVQDGETGILLRSQDPGLISEAITRLIENRRMAKSMGARGEKAAISQFGGQRFAKSMERLYLSRRDETHMDGSDGRKVSILHVIEELPFGGAENLLLTLARNIDRGRFNLVFCCLVKGGEIADKLTDEGFKVVCLESYRMRYLYKKILDIRRLIRAERIDIVQTHLISANLLGRVGALMTGATICKTEHAILPDLWRKPTVRNRAYLIADKLLNRFTDCIIYVSEAQRRLIQSDRQKLPKHIVIHNGFDEKHFTIHKTRERVRRLYGFSERDIVIGIVGRLVQQKGHRYLFEAMEKVREKYSGTKLLVVGSGPEELQLKELARSLELEVVFLSGRDDVPELMKAMDIYVQPSRSESFGISILEAMYSGLPVVATDRGGISEQVRDGETGILLTSQNPESISEAIMRLIENRRMAKSMGARGHDAAISRFSGDRFARDMEKLYSSLN